MNKLIKKQLCILTLAVAVMSSKKMDNVMASSLTQASQTSEIKASDLINESDGVCKDIPVIGGYGTKLNENQLMAYVDIYNNAMAYNENTFMFREKIPYDDLKGAFVALTADHAEMFWIYPSYAPLYKIENGTKMTYGIKLSYLFAEKDFPAYYENFKNVSNILVDEAAKMKTNKQKARFFHDYLLERAQYMETNDAAVDKDLLSAQDAKIYQSPYSAMCLDTTVCAGYTKAFQYLCNKAGVECYTVYSDMDMQAGIGHMWNIYKVKNGMYRNVDISIDNSVRKINKYLMFNVVDKNTTQDRSEMSKWIPECK